MSEWLHNLTVIVPGVLLVEANQLAMVLGTSAADAETFRAADWTDGAERYAVANARAVDQIMDYFALVPAELSANVVFPALDGEALTGSDMTKIQVFVDQEPFHVLSITGLARNEYL